VVAVVFAGLRVWAARHDEERSPERELVGAD
jgi:hypothetical protein